MCHAGYGAPPYPPAAGPNAVAVYVANLPPEADEGFLYKLFGIYGAIASVRIIRDPGSTACKVRDSNLNRSFCDHVFFFIYLPHEILPAIDLDVCAPGLRLCQFPAV